MSNTIWYPKNKTLFKVRAFIYRLTGWGTCQNEINEWVIAHGPFDSQLAFNIQLYVWLSEAGMYRYEFSQMFGIKRHWLMWPIYFPIEFVINLFKIKV